MIYDISYKTLIVAKPLPIRFSKIDGFIRIYDGTRYLLSCGSEKYDAIYNRIKYLISQKSGIKFFFPRNYARIKIALCEVLPLEKTITLYVIIFIKSVFNKNQNY